MTNPQQQILDNRDMGELKRNILLSISQGQSEIGKLKEVCVFTSTQWCSALIFKHAEYHALVALMGCFGWV